MGTEIALVTVMEQHQFAIATWPALRGRITEIVLGKIPKYKREPLDVVDAVHHRFPGWPWLEIAAWMDGSKVPSDMHQLAMCNWANALERVSKLQSE